MSFRRRGQDGLRHCRPERCPVLLVGGGRRTQRHLSAAGINLEVAGRSRWAPPSPWGTPRHAGGEPLMLTGDVAGLVASPD